MNRYKYAIIGVFVIAFLVLLLVIRQFCLNKQSESPGMPSPNISENFTPEPYPTPPSGRDITEEEAVERALYWDQFVTWEEPWSLKTFKENPERISVKLSSGEELGFSTDVEENVKVWVISIKGTANATNLMMNSGGNELVEGVTYIISSQTGELVGMHTEPIDQYPHN